MNEQVNRYLSSCTLPDWESIPDLGLYMDQLLTYESRCFPEIGSYLGLTASMINNYVKAGLIDKPLGKKYSRDSIAQLLMVSLLKQTTPMESMKKLLHPGDGLSTEARYREFRLAQERIVATYGSRPETSALSYALESASCHLITRVMLADQMSEEPADKNQKRN